MDEKINDYLVQLKGKASLGRPLQISKNYTIACRFDIVSEQKKDNHDGTCNIIYTGEPSGELVIQNENGKSIQVKTKASVSKTLRAAIWTAWKNGGSDLSDEEYYQKVGKFILDELPYLIERHKKEL